MRLSSLLCLCLLGPATAAPIAPACHQGRLTHAHWINLDSRRLFPLSDGNSVRTVTDVDSRHTTTLLRSPFHVLSNTDCNSPNGFSSSTTPLRSLRPRTDTGKMAAPFLSCASMAMLGFAFLALLLVSLYARYAQGSSPRHDRVTDAMATKPVPSRMAADGEVSDDFDDTDYPMG
ncbi:uncharacterized protein KD926_006410 [Aspergillus affinis]|uniref:uncharacterized protein n=1 Tax=Aspergillus affinis TaxID=1070780 RepID=UPI0022FEBE72|nr:uncharacterized protein KD926_006410 [Aspergillus affinis]KAI9041865.1 hypothetical protein KD926_006410 [Aspergillus affinis]